MRRLSQSPRDPAFVQDPYPFYHRARALGPLFLWEDYGFPCAAGHAEVTALLKDRRFGRELPAGLKPSRPGHLADFYALDDRSMLDREPPPTRGCAGWCCGPSPRGGSPGSGRKSRRWRRSWRRGSRRARRSHRALRRAVAGHRDRWLLGVPEAMAGRLLAWSHDMVAMYQARRDREVEDRANAAARDFADYLRRAPRGAAGGAGRRPHHRADRGRGRGRAARHRGADRDLRAPPQRRPRGDGARHRQRRGGDPRARASIAEPLFAGRKDDGGGRRGGAALRPAAPSLHPLRARGDGGLRPPLPAAATRVGCLLAAASRDPARFRIPTASTRATARTEPRLRRGDPLLRRRAAGARRTRRRAAGPLRAPARPRARRATGLRRPLSLPGTDRAQSALTPAQQTSWYRATQVASTSSPSRFHQVSAEKISTSCGP